ncbi:hypothetical protein PQO03_11515 [Lentisphaera profundi]|uniref:DUF6985 domain-containing protein n=1 Tax=Lentisphaera profundi TaxID=1658616 RepID=A0ABY7VRK5_9BACT|nr:hypothetical protein [Lentisphaera profundi]WDE96337.1 hypothetical protein PQO03_11515 [Lentisphaera profundi]
MLHLLYECRYVEKCINRFNNLPESLIDNLFESSIKYSQECQEYWADLGIDLDDEEIITKSNVKNNISPSLLIINEKPLDGDIVLSLELNCSWEDEHGMEWLIKGNNILYVGAYEGISTLHIPEEGNHA